MKIGFIGTGDITKAIVTGLMQSQYPVDAVILSPRNAQVSARLAAEHARVSVAESNQQVVDQADLVFLAILPQVAEEVIRSLRFRDDQKIASLIAMVTSDKVQEWTGTSKPIPRAVPLPAVANRQGATVLFPDDDDLRALFSELGPVVTATTPDEFDSYATASAVMGLYFDILTTGSEWLTAKGVSEADARVYLGKIFLELGRTAEQHADADFPTLRKEHSTTGGLNEQIVSVFTSEGGPAALKTAFNKVFKRITDARSAER